MQEQTSTQPEQEDHMDPQQDAVDQSAEKSLEEINEEIEQELEAEMADPIAELEAEVAKWKETSVRAIADLENYRKRMAREKADTIRFGNQGLLSELLPVLDNFDMGMMAAEQEAGSMIYMGMQMVQKQIGDFLTGQGVEVVEIKVGEDFDPNQHDAMSQEASDEVEEGKILRVMRKGYKMGERLIRPANVVVSQGTQQENNEPTEA